MSGAAEDEVPAQPGPLLAVYRTLPARIVGWAMVTGALAFGFAVVQTELQREGTVLVPLAVVVLVVAVVWAVLLRPHVELRADGVTQRNIVTDTEVPFSRLAEVGQQWALELTDTSGRRHSAWAVPKQREFSARRRFDDFAETTSRRRARPGITAAVVADDVQRAWHRWKLAGGHVEQDRAAHRQWAWSSLAPVLAALLLLGLAIAIEV